MLLKVMACIQVIGILYVIVFLMHRILLVSGGMISVEKSEIGKIAEDTGLIDE